MRGGSVELDERGTKPRDLRETLGFLEADVVAPDLHRWRLHPAFETALSVAAAGLVDLYSGNRIFNRLLADKGRVVFAHFVLYLHALPESEGGTDGRAHGRAVRRDEDLQPRAGAGAALPHAVGRADRARGEPP